jgi:hypothetical protein
MKGRSRSEPSRSRPRAKSPVPPKPKWKARNSDKSKDGHGGNRNGGCKDKDEHNGHKGKGKGSKTKTTSTGLEFVWGVSGWKPATICHNTRHSLACQGAHPTCKRRERPNLVYFGPPRGRAKRNQSDDDDDIFNESGLSPADITVICPSTPVSGPESESE